ncbi:MAG: TlpA family protein disulfide reductase [Lachnospiraceae bacterium]|nr:TlpA family protein disulfide reductase [Lachnospiraceae bacterium]
MKLENKWIKLSGILLIAVMLMTGCGKASDNTAAESNSEADTESIAAEDVTEESTGSEQADSGSKISAFTAKDLDGNTVTESIFGDKDLTVVNIWGTFCGPCVREMPELGAWAKDMPDNVQLIGLVIDIAGDEDTEHHDLAVSIMQNAEADFTQIIANQDFADILKDVYGVPTTMFVDKDGNIVGDSIIGADVDGYKKFVEDYLNEQ